MNRLHKVLMYCNFILLFVSFTCCSDFNFLQGKNFKASYVVTDTFDSKYYNLIYTQFSDTVIELIEGQTLWFYYQPYRVNEKIEGYPFVLNIYKGQEYWNQVDQITNYYSSDKEGFIEPLTGLIPGRYTLQVVNTKGEQFLTMIKVLENPMKIQYN